MSLSRWILQKIAVEVEVLGEEIALVNDLPLAGSGEDKGEISHSQK